MNTALEYSTRVVQEGGRRCKKSTLHDLVHLTPLRIPLMNPPHGLGGIIYNRIVDFVCAEAERLAGKGSTKKRAAPQEGPPGKKPRTEVARPRWVDESPSSTTMRGGPSRGSVRGRGHYDTYAYGRGGGRGGFNGGGVGEGGGRGRGWYNPGWRGRGR
jgi:hypothetical protein